MFSALIQAGALQLAAPVVTDVFLLILLLVFVLACVMGLRAKHAEFIHYAPTLMTSIGILGTFVGIVLGLFHFDTDQIDQSIPTLLEGLKTAFITSVAGMSSAMLFSLIDSLWLSKKRRSVDADSLSEITPADIYQVLTGQQQLMEQQHGQLERVLEQQARHNEQLQQRLGGWQEAQEKQAELFSLDLWQRMDTFSQMLSKSATEQVIDALRHVIVDFNKNLTEQFGDNFKALDASVHKLVIWQQQYKTQVDTMSDQYQQSVTALLETRKAVAGIWQECANIPAAMDDIRETLEINQHQIKELERHLEGLVTIREAAAAAIPTMQSHVLQMNEQVIGTVAHLERSAQGFEHYVTEIVTNTGQSVNTQLQQLETATAREIQTAIEEMGRSLVQITTRFVGDYQLMMNAMNTVVQQHKRQG
ncbi:MotA/TolQ/ExbB proton channel family protein [Paenalcaligenes faecalis]|uniref:MotA/TolQ/ExbB proton channel family protein n=1 Tax=Paenalcaligenes faecalis TaxID=2980099 RepID=UPI0022B95BDC|nr:MotA/TolQ/ExbB proton channel family protein [Paenalcaligenes faecalis]